MNDSRIYDLILAAAGKRGLQASLDSYDGHHEVFVDGLRNASTFSFDWKEGGEISYSLMIEYPDEAPDYRLFKANMGETPFTEVKANDGEFTVELIGHIDREAFTREAIERLFGEIEGNSFLELLQREAIDYGAPLDASGTDEEKVLQYFQTYGYGRTKIIRRALSMKMEMVRTCIDSLLRKNLIRPDEDCEYVYEGELNN